MMRRVAEGAFTSCRRLSPLLVLCHFTASHIAPVQATLVLPPAVRLKFGQEQALRRECEYATAHDSRFVWDSSASRGFEIATRVFRDIGRHIHSSERSTLWLPSATNMSALDSLVNVIRTNCDRLGLETIEASSWPEVPAARVELEWSTVHEALRSCTDEDTSKLMEAIVDTEKWVAETLCRLALCPYTSSQQRAAIGLESAGVSSGPVVVRHARSTFPNANRAAALTACFWEGVSELATMPEQEVATLLLIGPESYDDDFEAFSAACDELIEPSVQAVGATDIVGRAWFHPHYKTESIGHSTVIPGHALPSTMVGGFVDQYESASLNTPKPSAAMIAHANDAVRWTPHATVNLLRRSQLTAAKQVEAAAANKKPNAIYARNVLRIIDDGKLLTDNQ